MVFQDQDWGTLLLILRLGLSLEYPGHCIVHVAPPCVQFVILQFHNESTAEKCFILLFKQIEMIHASAVISLMISLM